jgi:hypothetical protein
MYTMTYVCEDCKLKAHSAAGDDAAIERFYSQHVGHNTHFNDFGETDDGTNTLAIYLKRREKEMSWWNHPISKFIRILKRENYRLSDAKWNNSPA